MEKRTDTKLANDDDCCAACLPSVLDAAEFEGAVRMFAGKWKVEILFALMHGPLRFGELRRSLSGITQHMLTAQLRELENAGLVLRTAYAEVPPRVDYELTEAAYALKPVFDSLVDWSRSYGRKVEADAIS